MANCGYGLEMQLSDYGSKLELLLDNCVSQSELWLDDYISKSIQQNHTLGAEGVIPGRYIVSLLRVFKQFTHTLSNR